MSKQDPRTIEAIVIGASAGGIKALLEILSPLPVGFPLPIIVVLHMPEKGTSKLVEVFQQFIKIPARQAQDKEKIAAGHLYFAAPGYHLAIEQDHRFSLSSEEPLHYSRPAIDILMTSAADVYGAGLCGLILTGANNDGAQGLANIKEAGGITLVQEPQEAEHPTMPTAAIQLCHPDRVLSLQEIHRLIHSFGAS